MTKHKTACIDALRVVMPELVKTIVDKHYTLQLEFYINLSKTKSLVSAIKDSGIKIPVIVGGYPFMKDEELWHKIGADGYCADFEEAHLLSERLTVGDSL